MKTEYIIRCTAFVIFAAVSVFGQGTFQNLDFEEANPGPFSGYVSVANALPGWTAYYGSVQQQMITFDSPAEGATEISLFSRSPGFPNLPVIQGEYSVLLQGGLTASAASISQTGTIPAGTESLIFAAIPGNGPLDVFVGGQIVPIEPVNNVRNYGVNISAWAGQTEPITFSAEEGLLNNWEIDAIEFSSTVTVTPEPSPFLLVGIGGALCAAYRRLSQKCK